MNIPWESHKNAVLTTKTDNYCLACEQHLQSEDEILDHIKTETHIQNLEITTKCDMFKSDMIRKVKKGYYCCYCNKMIIHVDSVKPHVLRQMHNHNKGLQVIRRVKGCIAGFGEVIIDKHAWHAMFDGTCLICNETYESELEHRADFGHLLNLSQTKCEYRDKIAYRNINRDKFVCLICSTVHFMFAKRTHHYQSSHIRWYYISTVRHHIITTRALNKVFLPDGPLVEELEQIFMAHYMKQVPRRQLNLCVRNSDSEYSNTSSDEPTNEGNTRISYRKVKRRNVIVKKRIVAVYNKKSKPEEPVTLTDPYELDIKIQSHLRATNYVMLDDETKGWCTLCDLKVENYEAHIKEPHHEMCSTKHKELLVKKVAKNVAKIVPEPTETAEEPEEVVPQKSKKIKKSTDEKLRDIIKGEFVDSELSSEEDDSAENTKKIIDYIYIFTENDVIVDLALQKAKCSKCERMLKYDFSVIIAHIKYHKKIDEKNEAKKQSEAQDPLSLPWVFPVPSTSTAETLNLEELSEKNDCVFPSPEKVD